MEIPMVSNKTRFNCTQYILRSTYDILQRWFTYISYLLRGGTTDYSFGVGKTSPIPVNHDKKLSEGLVNKDYNFRIDNYHGTYD